MVIEPEVSSAQGRGYHAPAVAPTGCARQCFASPPPETSTVENAHEIRGSHPAWHACHAHAFPRPATTQSLPSDTPSCNSPLDERMHAHEHQTPRHADKN